MAQINELRLEKEKLENGILKLKSTINANSNKVENLAFGSEIYKIGGEKLSPSKYSPSNYISCEVNLTWDEIFSAVVPYLVSYKNYDVFLGDLKKGINSAYKKNFLV